MTRDQFIDACVKIEYHQDTKMFGLYPFQFCALDKNNSLTVGVMLLGGDVVACYKAAEKMIMEGHPVFYMAIDFPKGLDIRTDFVAIFEYSDGESKVIAIPYDPATGKILFYLNDSLMLRSLKQAFDTIALHKPSPNFRHN